VRLGLAWLTARGDIRIASETGGEVQITPGDGRLAAEDELRVLDIRLKAALAETAAYRVYFRQADKEALLRGYAGRAT